MPERQPLVSVVIPAWNAEATIGQTLRSVAAQTYRNLEMIIVDDGSVDATAAVATEFCATDRRARLVSRSNGGPAAARNLGIAQSRGDWIALIDADDVWHPTKLQKQVSVAVSAAEPPGFVYCWYRIIDEEGCVTGSGPRWAAQGRAFLPLAYLHFIRGGSSLLLSKAAFVEAGGYDETFHEGCEDVLLELEIARRRPIAVVPEYLFGYRLHRQNFTRDFDLLLAGWIRALAIIEERAGLPRSLVRQVNAQCNLTIAEQRALQRKIGHSFKAAAHAIALDPVRSTLCLIGTAARLAARRLARKRGQIERRHFDDVDPTEWLAADSGGGRHPSWLVERLDARRMQNLCKA